MNKPILIIKAGSTYPSISMNHGDFEDWISAYAENQDIVHIVDVRKNPNLPSISQYSGVVVTGSPSMVTDEDYWIKSLLTWTRDAVEQNFPYFGICFGHQVLGKALGGEVNYNAKGMEVGTHRILLHSSALTDPLFINLPSYFSAHLVHRQSVISPPDNATILASNEHDSHQAFRVGQSAWGVQFHPEFTQEVMREYLVEMKEQLKNESLDFSQLCNNISSTPFPQQILNNFFKLCS